MACFISQVSCGFSAARGRAETYLFDIYYNIRLSSYALHLEMIDCRFDQVLLNDAKILETVARVTSFVLHFSPAAGRRRPV